MEQINGPQASHFLIKHLAEDDRPREKLLQKGRQYLSNAELLAILIGTGTRTQSAIDLGQHIMNLAQNNLNQLGKLTHKQLMQVNGIGEAKAVNLMAAFELGRRRKEEEAQQKTKVQTSKDAYLQFESMLEDNHHEEFWILLMSRGNHVIGKKQISTGGASGTVVDAKIVFKQALDHMASGIILCHNHPSGNVAPSQQDLTLTKKLVEAGKVMDIFVADHIIVGHQAYFSFADEGLMT